VEIEVDLTVGKRHNGDLLSGKHNLEDNNVLVLD
jgi:hypothetical protein